MLTNLEIFAGSMLPPTPTILGRRLLPLSCWHSLLLMLAGSPWLKGGASDWADVVFGVWVCSRAYDPAERWDFAKIAKEAVAWGKKNRGWDRDQAGALFAEYVDASFRFPSLRTPANGADSGVPWPFRAVATVMHYMPQLTEEQAWNLPVARIACYRACYAEDLGVPVTDDTTRQLIARARAAGAL